MCLLMLFDGLREEERAPICERADDAAVLEEESAGFEGDSKKDRQLSSKIQCQVCDRSRV